MGERRSRRALIPQRCLPATLGATRHTGSYQRVLSRPLAYLRQHGAAQSASRRPTETLASQAASYFCCIPRPPVPCAPPAPLWTRPCAGRAIPLLGGKKRKPRILETPEI